MTFEEFSEQFNNLPRKDQESLVTRRHPFYESKLGHWTFLEATYEGGRAWFDKNIHRFHREGDREYKERVARAYRFNHTREVVDLVNKYIFKPKIIRKTGDAPESINNFWKEATLSKKDITELMKLAAQRASIFGKSWIVVDSNSTGEVLTRADEKRLGIRPYVYIVSPKDLLDIAFSEDGTTEWALVREYHRDDSTPFSSGKVYPRYRVWMKSFWALIEEQRDSKGEVAGYRIADGRNTTIGEVPIVPVDHLIDENEYTGSSLIDDVAYLDRSVANYLSNLDEIIQDQTFSQLIIPYQAMMPTDDEDEDDASAVVKMGTKRIFTFDGQANVAPQFISPDPAQASLILKVIEKVISEIYHSTGLAGERTKQDNSMGIDNSSGVAKAFDFERMNAMLASKANALQQAENKVVRLVAKFVGESLEEPEKPWVQYPETFDVRSLYDEFEIAQRLALVSAPTKVRRQQMKQVAEKLFPNLKSADLEKVMEEIEKKWLLDDFNEGKGFSEPPKLTSANSEQGQNNSDDRGTEDVD